MHKESIKLAKLVSSSKKTISDLGKEVSKLNKELENLKTEVITLRSNDTIHSSTMHDSIEVSNSCNCCNKYIEEIKDLKNSCKFSIGKNNLDIILGKQKCVFNKAGLGYKPDKQQKFYKNFFASTQKYSYPFLTCFYCHKKGHDISTCYFKKNSNNIKMIWVPKGSYIKTNTLFATYSS